LIHCSITGFVRAHNQTEPDIGSSKNVQNVKRGGFLMSVDKIMKSGNLDKTVYRGKNILGKFRETFQKQERKLG